jgi:repressor LexA
MDHELLGLQGEIYKVILKYAREHGRPPTNREIGKAVGVESTGHIDYHLTVLEKKGYIVRERKKSRGIRLAEEVRGLRIEGTIAAGSPLDIYPDSQQETLDLASHTREYVLQVRGQSMIEDHIADGDYVLVEREGSVNDGDIIVATHLTAGGDGSATLKRLYKEADRIRLQPANSEMDPIYIDMDEWKREWAVQGKVTAVYRRC